MWGLCYYQWNVLDCLEPCLLSLCYIIWTQLKIAPCCESYYFYYFYYFVRCVLCAVIYLLCAAAIELWKILIVWRKIFVEYCFDTIFCYTSQVMWNYSYIGYYYCCYYYCDELLLLLCDHLFLYVCVVIISSLLLLRYGSLLLNTYICHYYRFI